MAYVMRSCGVGGASYGGFVWPLEVGAVVEAPDWDPSPRCGNGLHGFLNGEGDGALADFSDDAIWMILWVEDCDIVDLGGKVKFPKCVVSYVGSRLDVIGRIVDLCPGFAVIGASVVVGYRGTATAGDRGTATAGVGGTATAGDGGTATAGDRGTATVGEDGTATAGDGGIISIRWFDGVRYRVAIGYVGEAGIEPNVAYRVEGGKFVRA